MATTEIETRLASRLPLQELQTLAKEWGLSELAVFGSVLRDDFNDESDIDFLYTRLPNVLWKDWGLVRFFLAFKDLVGREIDMVYRPSLEESRNHYKREAILGTAVVIYESR